VQHLVEQAVVFGDRGSLGADFFELGDVGAGGEGLGAGAPKGQAAHLGIGVELRHGRRDAAPHRAVDGVALLRLTENDPADGPAFFDH
jgi:hypothetical protein